MREWLKKGFSPENIVQTVVSIIAGLGVPALIRAFAHVSMASLVVMGIGTAFLVFGALLVVRGRFYATLGPEIRKAMEGLKFTVGPSIPVGARQTGVPPWYVSHEGGPTVGAPPHRSATLRLTSGETGIGARRIACEVSDPDLESRVYRFWNEETATYHLSELTQASCVYPKEFVPLVPGNYEDPVFPRDGHYEVRWWKFDEVGGRDLLATDTFEVRDGGLVQS
ncbi:MAG: hypothetical protein M3O98_10585 [Actinomycetota bacterium]|nr:hypothetical protein [Actinomycetota bacterium]